MVDGKTYYFMFDKYKILHVCSDGYTKCGKKVDSEYYTEASEETFPKFVEICSNCQSEKKTAEFTTKAEFTTPEKEG